MFNTAKKLVEDCKVVNYDIENEFRVICVHPSNYYVELYI
jgi:hypothetical protein